MGIVFFKNRSNIIWAGLYMFVRDRDKKSIHGRHWSFQYFSPDPTNLIELQYISSLHQVIV